MSRYSISLIFLLPLFFFAQEADTTLIRLQKEVKLAQTDSIKINALLALAEVQYDRNFSSTEHLVNEALQLIQAGNEIPNQQQLAKAYVVKGVINRREANYVRALEYYFKAKEIYESENDTLHISDLYHNMAMVYRFQRTHDKAIALYKKSIEIKEPLKDTHGIAAGYNMMGVSYRQNKELDSALICYTKAKKIFS